MSSKGKKKKSLQKNIGDVTINDFANAAVCKNRIKKSTLPKVNDERSWDEKDEHEFEEIDFNQESENETKTVELKKRDKTRKKNIVEERKSYGKDYPLDIWFLISEYIRPDDVGRFSLICRASLTVTCSAKFWFCLYRKYYRGVSTLPERLQPECMVRLYGLRACVIRALHHFYQPFIKVAETANRAFHEHPSALVKRICVTAWHEKQSKTCWMYRWKLREPSNIILQSHSTSCKPDLLEMLDDVSANPEEGCRILQMACPHFVAMPPVMGLRLISAKVSLSQGFSSHRVTLRFSLTGSNTSVDSNSIEIILDPVVRASVLDWWHPKYPHPTLNTPVFETGEGT